MIDLDNLRKKAEAATPGPWKAVGQTVANKYGGTLVRGHEWDGLLFELAEGHMEHDPAYVAAADPSTVLALIDRCEAAEAAVARVRKVLEEWVAEYDDPVYRGNGFTDGVTAASKHALSALDGEDA